MISMTPTLAPADLLGLGGFDVCARPVPVAGAGTAVRLAALGAPFGATRLPIGGGAVRLRPVARQPITHDVVTTIFTQNDGTTLGIPSSRRPQS
jgi:hypothetical protein